MIKGEAPFVSGTPEEVERGNRIHTLNTLTSNSQELLLVWWRHLIKGYICSQPTRATKILPIKITTHMNQMLHYVSSGS